MVFFPSTVNFSIFGFAWFSFTTCWHLCAYVRACTWTMADIWSSCVVLVSHKPLFEWERVCNASVCFSLRFVWLVVFVFAGPVRGAMAVVHRILCRACLCVHASFMRLSLHETPIMHKERTSCCYQLSRARHRVSCFIRLHSCTLVKCTKQINTTTNRNQESIDGCVNHSEKKQPWCKLPAGKHTHTSFPLTSYENTPTLWGLSPRTACPLPTGTTSIPSRTDVDCSPLPLRRPYWFGNPPTRPSPDPIPTPTRPFVTTTAPGLSLGSQFVHQLPQTERTEGTTHAKMSTKPNKTITNQRVITNTAPACQQMRETCRTAFGLRRTVPGCVLGQQSTFVHHVKR